MGGGADFGYSVGAMGFNPLDHAVFTYQPIWGDGRRLIGARLQARLLDDGVDAPHLLHAMADWWSAGSPFLLVAFADQRPVFQALSASPPDHVWLEVPDFGPRMPPELLQALTQARRLGHRLVQNLPLARAHPVTGSAAERFRYLLHLWPDHVRQALSAQRPADSPVLPGQLYGAIGQVALAAHCLDVRQAWGVVGWPDDDALASRPASALGVDKGALLRVQQALLREASIETVIGLVHSDVLLTYRLLQLVNGDAFGTGREVSSVRQAVLLLGERRFRDALLRLLPGAVSDPDLQPVRQALVLRAQLMQMLMDAGAQHELATEIYLTGLFSTLDRWLRVPLAQALERVPLSEAITEALLAGEGPYGVYLDLARRLADPAQSQHLPARMQEEGFALSHVNTALLRTLARWRSSV